MPLTESQIKKLQPKDKSYLVCDYDCLYLLIYPSGRKSWIYRPRGSGAKKVTLGTWPDMSLIDARRHRDGRRCVNSDSSLTFREIASDWLKRQVIPVQVPSHVSRQISRMERLIYPVIGDVPLRQITSAMVLHLIREIEARGNYATAHKVINIIGQVLRYGIAQKQAEHDITAELRGALAPVPDRHFSSIQDSNTLGGLMRAIATLSSRTVRCALQLEAYTFVRPGELRQAEWSEIDFDKAEWRIPLEKMKRRRPHIVPLSQQALAVLEEMHVSAGKYQYVFPDARTHAHPMSNMTMLAALRRLGFEQSEMTVHGFRSIASTTLNEFGWPADAIERQLAHVEGNAVRAAYNYAQFMDTRRAMMQWYADYLDARRDGTALPQRPKL